MELITDPYLYQKEDVLAAHYKFNGRVLFAHEMGCGKSLEAIAYAVKLGRFPLLAVCPAGLKYNWANEFKIHAGLPSYICEGRKVPPKFKQRPITICNYEILDAWWKHFDPVCVIFDECHYLKNKQAKRTKAARMLAADVPYVLALSATPIEKRPIEFFPVLNMLRPDIFNSEFFYGKRYCDGHKTYFGWEFKGASNIEELHEKLCQHLMIRRLKKDVLPYLPEKIRTMVPMEIENRATYLKAENHFLLWLKQHDPKKLLAAMKAEAVMKFGELKRLAARLKMKSVAKWIENFRESSDEKLLVMGIHKEFLKGLYDKNQKKAVYVDGSVNSKNKEIRRELFTHGHVSDYYGQLRANYCGWNAVPANNMLFTEIYENPAIHAQAEGRVDRIGAKLCPNIYYGYAKGTIEERLCHMVQSEWEVVSGILDGENVESLDLYDQIIEKERELAA